MKADKEAGPADPSTPPSSIVFRLEPHSGIPPYRQLVQQVEHAVRLGYLTLGDQLPRVKDVVASLSINPNTVLKAYRELEQKGIVAGRPGFGTFVDVSPETVSIGELTALRRSLVTGWLRDAAASGLAEDEIVALFTCALGDFREQPGWHQPARRDGQSVAQSRGEGVA